MGEVIGYKGTAAERLLSWNTMLMLRTSLAWMNSQKDKFKPAIDKEKRWYRSEFDNYRQVG